MKTLFILILFLSLILFVQCKEEPLKSEGIIELREDFSESEFKQAIIGKWESIYIIQREENVKHLEFDNQGNAKIILVKENIENEYEGNYTLSFIRQPSKGKVTISEIKITTLNKEIYLKQVSFGLHNAIEISDTLLLRIDESPYGVLEKVN